MLYHIIVSHNSVIYIEIILFLLKVVNGRSTGLKNNLLSGSMEYYNQVLLYARY